MTWRTGRKNGRTIYEQRGTEPSDDDKPIGMMDTAALAAHVVEAVNAWDAIDEPGKYEARCECGHPSKEHHYRNGCERITREVGGWRNCVCMNDSRGQDYRDVRAAEYTDGPPLLCPECGHSQNAHVQLEELGCTKPIFAAPGDWHSDCPCKLTYDQVTARLAGPDAQLCGSCGHHTTAHVPAAAPSQVGCLVDVLDEYEQKAYCPCVLNQEEAEMTARLAAHGLAEDEPMPASCLLGRCGHDKAEPVTDMGKWFTKDELAGIADDGVNRMERADNVAEAIRHGEPEGFDMNGWFAQAYAALVFPDLPVPRIPRMRRSERLPEDDLGLPDDAPKIAEVAARPRRFRHDGEATPSPKGETSPQDATTTAPSSTSGTDSAALSPDMWSAHGEAGLEPREWYPGEPPATEEWQHKAWAHMPAIAEKMGAGDEPPAEEGTTWSPEQRRLLNKLWLDLMVKGEAFMKAGLGTVTVGDPAAPEDVVVVELARGGIVTGGPLVTGDQHLGLGSTFTVPDGIRQALGEGSGNVQVTITGPEGKPLGELINQALLDAVKRENPLTGRREPEVQIIDSPTSEMSEELRALVIDWATRARDETGRWPTTTGWIKDAVEQVLPEVQEYFEAEMHAAGIDPEGMEIEYDFAPAERRYTRPGRPVVDVELPAEPEYRDPDCYVDDNGWCICRKCGTRAMSFKDGGWACNCDSAMHEHMRPEADDNDV